MQRWQTLLKTAITQPAELCRLLGLEDSDFPRGLLANPFFKLRVPRAFVARMQPNNPRDPLLLQVLPRAEEILCPPGYSCDPLDEKSSNPIAGLLHKYHGRVLLTLSAGCAVNCRYCFRQHFPYSDNAIDPVSWRNILNYLDKQKDIQEIILSGGDPLLVKDTLLKRYLDGLAQIGHIKRLRIHTRLPIVIPERITQALTEILTRYAFKTVMVVHVNHARELDHAVAKALQKLRDKRIPLFNQAVLLKDINDHVQTLVDLSERLFEIGVLPYYLHMLDHVQGAAHFEVSQTQAIELLQKVATQLPGYLVPRLVREVPGALAKAPICVPTVYKVQA